MPPSELIPVSAWWTALNGVKQGQPAGGSVHTVLLPLSSNSFFFKFAYQSASRTSTSVLIALACVYLCIVLGGIHRPCTQSSVTSVYPATIHRHQSFVLCVSGFRVHIGHSKRVGQTRVCQAVASHNVQTTLCIKPSAGLARPITQTASFKPNCMHFALRVSVWLGCLAEGCHSSPDHRSHFAHYIWMLCFWRGSL